MKIFRGPRLRVILASRLTKLSLVSTFVLVAALCLTTFAVRPARAKAKTAASLAASHFVGKSFVEGEKILGKPKLIEKSNLHGGCYVRYYKTPAPGLTRIILYVTIGPRVGEMAYNFPKGQVKTWKSACAKVGISIQGVSVAYTNGSYTTLKGLPGDQMASWVPGKDVDILEVWEQEIGHT